ncbi:MAG: hypothetical protein ABR964_09745 [Tepidisphaeraceae bacterium]|jgi:hypothetical protein
MALDANDAFSSLYKKQTALLTTFPKARSELLDFHYKDQLDQYLFAIDHFTGRKLFIIAKSEPEAASLIRRSLLLSDLLLFNVESFIAHPALGLLPISDDVASPVLGAIAMIDPHGRSGFASAAAFMYANVTQMTLAAKAGERAEILGSPWSATESDGWQRTMFTRLSDEMQNAHGSRCHVAGGLIHLQLPKDETLLADAARLMSKGRVVYAPFALAGAGNGPQGESLLKASMLGSALASSEPSTQSLAQLERVLLKFDMPYLEDLPLSTLAKVIDDEGESIRSFRRQFDRLMEDIQDSKDEADADKRVTKFKREVLEDEIDKVRHALSRVSRMNSVTRAGAYLGVTALTVAVFNGLSVPSLITGLSGTAAAAVTAWYRSYLEARDACRSPAHVLWRLERRANKGN